MSKEKGKGSEKDIGSREQFEEHVKRLNMSDDSLIGLYRTMCTVCLLYTSPSPRDRTRSRMPSSA